MATTIQIVLRKDKVNLKGDMPIYFRITKNRRSTNIFSGYRIKEKHWDKERRKVKLSHPNSVKINSLLAKKEAAFMDNLMDVESVDLTASLRIIKDKLNGVNHTDFYQVADVIAQGYKLRGQIGSYDKARSIVKKLRDYTGKTKLLLTDMDVVFIKQYEKYLVETKKNSPNTIHKDLKFIRQIFLTAIREGAIEQKHNPFGRIRLTMVKTSREYLLQNEIDVLLALPLEDNLLLQKHRDMFVFSCYACGLRISDVLLMKWQHVNDNRLNITIQKTGTQFSQYIPKPAVEIINKYKKSTIQPTDFIFSALPADINLKNPAAVDSAISGATAKINKSLKVIASKAGISKHLSFHVSRHSFATNALRKGIPLEQVQKLMGHSNIRETQIYAKIVDIDLDESMKLFDHR